MFPASSSLNQSPNERQSLLELIHSCENLSTADTRPTVTLSSDMLLSRNLLLSPSSSPPHSVSLNLHDNATGISSNGGSSSCVNTTTGNGSNISSGGSSSPTTPPISWLTISCVICFICILAASQFSSYIFGFICGLGVGLLSYHAFVTLNTRSRPEVFCVFPPLPDNAPPLVPEFVPDECKVGESVQHLTTTMSMSLTAAPNSSVSVSSSSSTSVSSSNLPVYQTWMNELSDYKAEHFHLNKTFSIFVTLEGTNLRLQRTKQRVNKRVMFNDKPVSSVQFVHQRIYNLLHARVSLKPEFLVHKRQWSKKYPICVLLSADNNDFKSPTSGGGGGSSGTQQGNSWSHGKQALKDFVRNRTNKSSTTTPTTGNASTCSSSSTITSDCKEDAFSSTGGDLLLKDVAAAATGVENASESDLASVASSSSNGVILYLFTRTCREKEHWYRLLQHAAMGRPLVTSISHIVNTALAQEKEANNQSSSGTATAGGSEEDAPTTTATSSQSSLGTSASESLRRGSTGKILPRSVPESVQYAYVRHMAKSMPADFLLRASQIQQWNINYISCDPQFIWINALIGRLFWDFLREPFWAEQVKAKVQAKLKKLHLPYFIDEITVIDIDLGSELPIIRRTHRTYLDSFGLWIDLDVGYKGGFSMTLETKVNPLKMRRAMEEKNPPNGGGSGGGGADCDTHSTKSSEDGSDTGSLFPSQSDSHLSEPSKSMDRRSNKSKSSSSSHSHIRDHEKFLLNQRLGGAHFSDEEDSVESSTGDELSSDPEADNDEPISSAGKGRLWRLMDKIGKSPFLAKAMDNKYVKKGMEMVRRTSLVLQVDVHYLHGTMCINIPPPPSDRLWYGFRENPQLKLSAKPRVGDRNITLTRLVEWIENKLIVEIQRLLVFPNMDDFVVPLLLDNNPKYFGHNR